MGARQLPVWAKRTAEYLPEVEKADKMDQLKWLIAGCRAEFLEVCMEALKRDRADLIRTMGTDLMPCEWAVLRLACDRMGLTEWYQRKKGLADAGIVISVN